MKKIINSIILLSYLCVALYLIFILNEYLTTKELMIIISFLIVIEIIFIYLLKKDILIFFSYPCILFVLICLFTFNIKSNDIISFANDINSNTDYSLVTLKNKVLPDLVKIGYVKVLKEFNNLEFDYEPNCYSNVNEMIIDLNNEKIDAIILESDQYDRLNHDKYVNISKLILEERVVPTAKNNSNTKLIYVSSNNDISNVNINIVLGINTKTKELVIIGIPKDYYISFKDDKEVLFNINKFGLNDSIKAIEGIIENNIDYYINIDLDNLKEIDSLEQLEVISDFEFISSGFEFKKGENKLTSDSLIPFIRYSNALMGGSRIQNTNQMIFLESLLNKLLSDNKYLNILTELKDVIVTNIPKEEIIKFIKNQITYNYKWNTLKYGLDGADDFKYTYLSKCCKLSVMNPDVTTINNAITIIEYLKSNSVFN